MGGGRLGVQGQGGGGAGAAGASAFSLVQKLDAASIPVTIKRLLLVLEDQCLLRLHTPQLPFDKQNQGMQREAVNVC